MIMLGFYLNICNRIYECYKISKHPLFCDSLEEKGSIKMVDWGCEACTKPWVKTKHGSTQEARGRKIRSSCDLQLLMSGR